MGLQVNVALRQQERHRTGWMTRRHRMGWVATRRAMSLNRSGASETRD